MTVFKPNSSGGYGLTAAVEFGAVESDAAILRHFSREVLDNARSRITVLDELLNLLAKAEIKT